MLLLRINIFYLYICVGSIILAAPDCLDNSWHMQHDNDLKSYHSVSCTCPCGRYMPNEQYRLLSDRNRCFTCKHYHNTRPVVSKTSSRVQYTLDASLLSHFIAHPQGKRLHTLFGVKYPHQFRAKLNKN